MLLGGKASSLVRLLNLGAPVPPAFVLTTDAYREWAENPEGALLASFLQEGIGALEDRTGRRFGNGMNGLVVSVRSGAPVSMPGMMDTVLNVGIGSVEPGAIPFAHDARSRFLWQYAELVLEIDGAALEALREKFGAPSFESNSALEKSLEAEAGRRGKRWPETPLQELAGAAQAVFASWQSSRAKLYRRMKKIDESIGTTVTVQQMVFGNRDANSGSGVAFTRDPTTGDDGLCGEFLFGGQGEEVVSGRETANGLTPWRQRQPLLFDQLQTLGRHLESSTSKVHEIEFTVEQGDFYVLQCRPALLTARAGARVAVQLFKDGRISQNDALAYARANGFDSSASGRGLSAAGLAKQVGSGLPVGGGVSTGRVAFGDSKMEELKLAGDPAVLMTVETSPKSLPLMRRCAALVTMRGGATSHAAVVARELGRPCVVGVGGEISGHTARMSDSIAEGDWVTVDGDRGLIFAGKATTIEDMLSAEERQLREWATLDAASSNASS
jgi:pyruvate,orthophosphate dikinase